MNVRRLIKQFLPVIASSRKAEFSFLAAGLLPSLIACFGGIVVSAIDVPKVLCSPLRERLLSIYLGLAMVTFVKLSLLPSKHYRGARDRLYR